MKIYKLTTDTHRYSNLAFARDEDAKLFRRFEGTPILPGWAAVEVVPADEDSADVELADFSLLGTIPVLSSRAAEQLGDVLMKHGELLPLRTDFGAFFAYNVTTVRNALDETRSDVDRFSSGEIMRINQFKFHDGVVGDAEIFKIPQKLRSMVFVTNRFVRRVRPEELAGFAFTELWSTNTT